MSGFQSFIDSIKSGSDGEIANKFRIEYLERRNEYLWSLLHYACYYGRVGLVRILIDNKCDINASDKGGDKSIHLACRNGHIDIVKLLIYNKCDINASGYYKYQPIHWACRNGHIDVVRILIANKCNINASGENGSKPIHLACRDGHIDIVKILIENKCDLKVLTIDGESPIDMARKNGHYQIIDIVKQSAVDPMESIIHALNLQCSTNCDHKFCSQTLKQGKLPEGKFIGKGAFGQVYKCKISNTNREIVIKKTGEVYEDTRNIERNINKFSSQIIHENIVRYFGALENSGTFCIFMEYISGGSLNDLIDKVGMIETNKAIQYSKQILVGLQFLHSKTIIHRDIKPPNILLDHNETVKLSDFGISKTLQKTFSNSIEKAVTFCGTPNYLAPEVVLNKPYDYPADIWSTGATIIHMITGKIPYHNLNPSAVIYKIGETKKIKFTTCQPISKIMKSFIDDLLNPDQSKRPKAEFLLKHPIFYNLS